MVNVAMLFQVNVNIILLSGNTHISIPSATRTIPPTFLESILRLVTEVMNLAGLWLRPKKQSFGE